MFCREQVAQLRDKIDEIRIRGGELVIIGNGSAYFAKAFKEDFELDCPVLVDTDLRSYRVAGLRRGRVEVLSPQVPLNAIRALKSGARQDGVKGDPWQLGGVFVIRSDGEVTYRYVSDAAGDHAPLSEVFAALNSKAPVMNPPLTTSPWQARVGRALSSIMDPLIVPSFDRTGFKLHSLGFDPADLDVDLSEKRCLVTGANSGIGFETALSLADLGAEVVLLCRNEAKGTEAANKIRNQTGNNRVSVDVVDMSDQKSIRAAGKRLSAAPVHVLVHNAGVLPDHRLETDDEQEMTFATHVSGPFLLTQLLLSSLEKADGARVVWVSSGGMYTKRLNLRDPQWIKREYDGVAAYAETKRAQVILSELWAKKLRGSRVVVNAMHPGWADTPSVESSLPLFHRITRQILRTPAEGADTVVWLAAAERTGKPTGKFFFDRLARRTHFLSSTKEEAKERQALWRLCDQLTMGSAE